MEDGLLEQGYFTHLSSNLNFCFDLFFLVFLLALSFFWETLDN